MDVEACRVETCQRVRQFSKETQKEVDIVSIFGRCIGGEVDVEV